MSELKKKNAKKQNVLIASVVGVFALCVAVLVFSVFFTGKVEQRKKEIQMITLLPPPPPPVDIPPPPPVEEKIEEQIQQPDEPEQEAEAPPQELGVDAEAGLGDDFGLKARKGGQGLIGGQGGSIYGWYTNLLSTDLQKMVNEIIQKEGGLPDGKWRTVVKVELDVYGKIKKFSIIGSSGNQKMDAAVNKALASAQVNEPPPPGMPRIMKLSFTI